MKRFLTMFVMLLLMAVPAFAQVDFPEEFAGERYNEWLTIRVQCELVEHEAAWGSVLDNDPDVVFFGTLAMDGDVLTLDIQWLGNHSGYAPSEGRGALRDMKFTWNEDMQGYATLVSSTPTVYAFQTLTVREGGNEIWWRTGRFVFDPEAGLWGKWGVAAFPYDEWKCGDQVLEPWRHSQGRRSSKSLQQHR